MADDHEYDVEAFADLLLTGDGPLREGMVKVVERLHGPTAAALVAELAARTHSHPLPSFTKDTWQGKEAVEREITDALAGAFGGEVVAYGDRLEQVEKERDDLRDRLAKTLEVSLRLQRLWEEQRGKAGLLSDAAYWLEGLAEKGHAAIEWGDESSKREAQAIVRRLRETANRWEVDSRKEVADVARDG